MKIISQFYQNKLKWKCLIFLWNKNISIIPNEDIKDNPIKIQISDQNFDIEPNELLFIEKLENYHEKKRAVALSMEDFQQDIFIGPEAIEMSCKIPNEHHQINISPKIMEMKLKKSLAEDQQIFIQPN